MRRRRFLGASVALTLASGTRAQASRVLRIAWVSSDRAAGNSGYDAFLGGMRERGYVEGRNLAVEPRWGDGAWETMAPVVADVVRLRPDVIVTQGPVVRIVAQSGTSIPVVFAFSGDPVVGGFVDSFARPGRNFTGLSFLSLDLVGKRIEIMKEALPTTRRIAVVANQAHPGEPAELRASNQAAEKLGLAVEYFPLRAAPDLDGALQRVAASTCDSVVVFPDAGMMRRAADVAAFSRQRRIPAVSGWAVFARSGNLLSYGANLESGFARLAYYVDRIAKGARPEELPVELPTKVELVVNTGTAKALSMTIPQSLLLRADEVIR